MNKNSASSSGQFVLPISFKNLLLWILSFTSFIPLGQVFAYEIPAPRVFNCSTISSGWETGNWLTEGGASNEWLRMVSEANPEYTVLMLLPASYNPEVVEFYCEVKRAGHEQEGGATALLVKGYSCTYKTSTTTTVNLGVLNSSTVDGKTKYTCNTPDPVEPKNNGPCLKSCDQMAGNPINAGTGNKYQVENDYSGDRFSFSRYYNSKGNIANLPFGPMWLHSYSLRIDTLKSDPALIALAQREDGRLLRFTSNGTSWVAESDSVYRLSTTTDAQGKINSWTLTTPSTVEKYGADGNISELIWVSGERLLFGYSIASTPTAIAPFVGMLISVQASSGQQLLLRYDAFRRIREMVDPAGGVTTYGYTLDRSLLSTVTYPGGATRQYHYGETMHTSGASLPYALTGVTDENNSRFATFKFDAGGRAVSTEHAGGVNRYSVSYSANQAVVTTPLAAVNNFSFTSVVGNVLSTSKSWPAGAGSGPANNATTFDVNANVNSRIDRNNVKTCYGYDLSRNLETKRVEGLPAAADCAVALSSPPVGNAIRTISTQWHPDWRIEVKRSEPTKLTTTSYNGQGASCAPTDAIVDGKPIAVVCSRTEQETTDATGAAGVNATVIGPTRTWSYTYGSTGKVLTIDGPRTDVNDTTTYSYYSCAAGYHCGQVQTITNALGHVTTFNSYNGHGQPLTITDANNVVTTLTYDERQRLKSRTAAGETTNLFYFPTGLLQKMEMPDGSFISYSYDTAHRLTEISDSLGNIMVYTLDAMGNRTAVNVYDSSNSLTRGRSRVFDSLSRLSQDLTASASANQATLFGYDANGNQTTINAPLSRNSISVYDEFSRLKQVTDANGGITQYGYNALDQLISVIDPRNLQTIYTYNALGDLKQQVSPDTGTTNNTFDSAGNLKTSTDARNKTATYTYDALNRITQLVHADQTLTYTYDSGVNAIGRLSFVTDSSGSTSWTYTAQGRVATKTQTMGTLVKTVQYGYNAAGQLTTVTTPSNKTIAYGYTSNQVTNMMVNSVNLLNSVLYEPFGPTSGWTWGNGTLAVRTYDIDGRLTQLDSAGFKTIGYDDAFRITSVTDQDNSANSWEYGYDTLDRLTSAIGSQTQSFTFDANGNRLTQSGTTSSTFTPASTSNRLSGVSGALSKSYLYDNVGNTTSDGTITYTYNDAGRMISATKASVTTTYAYNAIGQRVSKTTAGSTTYFVYDEAGHILGEYDNTGWLIQETAWMYDTPVASIRFGSCGLAVFYIHTDHLNTPRRITKRSSNEIVWRWDSDAFGATQANENPSGVGAFVFNLRFPGQYFDRETGNHYNYFRNYDPTTGRYVESDPIGLSGGTNTYSYVGGSPMLMIDPFGLYEGSRTPTCSDHFGPVQARKRPWTKPVTDWEYRIVLYGIQVRSGVAAHSFRNPFPVPDLDMVLTYRQERRATLTTYFGVTTTKFRIKNVICEANWTDDCGNPQRHYTDMSYEDIIKVQADWYTQPTTKTSFPWEWTGYEFSWEVPPWPL